MSRRKPREEMEFGSDSFLDVVANVVGILIILMVLAGIRAKTAPVVLDEEQATEKPVVDVPQIVSASDRSMRRRREHASVR